MYIFITDENLNVLGVIDDFISLSYSFKNNRTGNFSFECIINNDNRQYIKKGNFVYLSNEKTGFVITNIEITQAETEIIKVTGLCFKHLLTYRIIWGTLFSNGKVEQYLKDILNNNFIEPYSANRRIDILKLGNIADTDYIIKSQNSFSECYELIKDICDAAGISFELNIDLENKKILFETYKNQILDYNSLNPVIFSNEFDNIETFNILMDDSSHKNTCLIGGVGEGSERIFTSLGDNYGLERKEFFVDAKDLSNKEEITKEVGVDEEGNPVFETQEIPLQPSIYEDMLKQRGREKLEELKETLECDININDNNKSFVYGIDYNLGDTISYINKKYGILINVKVSEVQFNYNNNSTSRNIILGNPIITLKEKLKKLGGK